MARTRKEELDAEIAQLEAKLAELRDEARQPKNSGWDIQPAMGPVGIEGQSVKIKNGYVIIPGEFDPDNELDPWGTDLLILVHVDKGKVDKAEMAKVVRLISLIPMMVQLLEENDLLGELRDFNEPLPE